MFTLEVGRNALAVCLWSMTMSLVNLCAFVRRVPLRQSAMKVWNHFTISTPNSTIYFSHANSTTLQALRLAIGFECEPLLRGPTMGGVMVSTTTASEQSTMSMKEKAMFESTFLNFLIGGEKFRRWRLSMRILKVRLAYKRLNNSKHFRMDHNHHSEPWTRRWAIRR